MRMYYATIIQIQKMLDQVLHWMDKTESYAETRKFDPNVIIDSRLSPDMYPFGRQIQIITDNAKGIAGRLGGKTPPTIEDTEKTFAELRERVAVVKKFIGGFTEADFAQADDAKCVLGFLPDQYMKGDEYLHQFGLPNLYFHLATAYGILRHNGVPLGKGDYIGKMPLRDL